MPAKVIANQESLEAHINHVRAMFAKHGIIKAEVKNGKQRTLTQNAALHKYCELLAETLNDAGMDMRTVLKEGVDIPWTQQSVKEHLWKPIQKVVIDKQSTTDADTSEYSKVYTVLSKHLSETRGIYVPFPSREAA